MKSISIALISFLHFSTLFADEVSITIQGKQLFGTLEPSTNNKRVALILAGSGPTNRDGNTVGAFGKNNSLKHLSDALVKGGIATLRIDKRGVGKSSQAAV